MRRILAHVERFRSGGNFLVALSILLVLWFAVNSQLHFDPENLTLNLLLSIEAAYAMPVLLMASQRRADAESARLKEVLGSTHEMIRMLKGVAEDVEGIEEKVGDAVD